MMAVECHESGEADEVDAHLRLPNSPVAGLRLQAGSMGMAANPVEETSRDGLPFAERRAPAAGWIASHYPDEAIVASDEMGGE